MAVYAGKQGAIICVSAVCDFFFQVVYSLLTILLDSLTQATDTGNIRLVFAAVKETILQNALKDSGIL